MSNATNEFISGDMDGLGEVESPAQKLPHTPRTTTERPATTQYSVPDGVVANRYNAPKRDTSNVDPKNPKASDTVWSVADLVRKLTDRRDAMQAAPTLPWDAKDPTMYVHPMCIPWGTELQDELQRLRLNPWLRCSACGEAPAYGKCEHLPKGGDDAV
jgi:hypothetical protein